MDLKVILSGHLGFGSERSFRKAKEMYEHKLEKAYKNDVMINGEEAFDEEQLAFRISRASGTVGDKTWRNTISILELLTEFSVAGSFSVWRLDGGAVKNKSIMEPKSEKMAVQSFLSGRELLTEGKQTEAKEALSNAISRFSRHASAYERRGYVNYLLGNIDDALYDFSKSIDICPQISEAFYGRASIYMKRGEYKLASADLDMITKTSIPHQPIYWKARRLKGDCHIYLNEHKEAAREYKFFTSKVFKPDNPNAKWVKKINQEYGLALVELKMYNDAIAAFDKALAAEEGKGEVKDADLHFYRGLAMKNAGKKGYQAEINKAANFGCTQAKEMLAATA